MDQEEEDPFSDAAEVDNDVNLMDDGQYDDDAVDVDDGVEYKGNGSRYPSGGDPDGFVHVHVSVAY
jgi:hypothetical protein